MPKNRWNRDLIIAELKRCRQNGPKANPRLDAAARKHFGSLRAALEIAGLPCATRPPPYNKWSRQSVIEGIRKRHRDGESLERTSRDDRLLYSAGKRLFGNWSVARAAAGYPRPMREFHTADEVRLRIIDLYENGVPLSLNSQNDQKLKRSVIKHFRGWRRAVESLGLGGELRRVWTDQAVIDAILLRRAEGKSIYTTREEDSGLFGAAVNRFGTWYNALQAAGIEGWVREKWNKEKVVERLQRLTKDKVPEWKIRRIDPKVASAALRHFGSLRKAMLAAGFEAPKPGWSVEQVIEEIRTRSSNDEQASLRGFGERQLAEAATRLFGSWAEAVEAAGLIDRIPVKKPPRRWKKEDILRDIRAWHAKLGSLKHMEKMNKELVTVARLHFGSWILAIEAAGLCCNHCKWTRENILDEIKRRRKLGESLSTYDHSNVNLAAAARRYFGSWAAALLAAGVASKQRKPRKPR
jgi:hypothetical protein